MGPPEKSKRLSVIGLPIMAIGVILVASQMLAGAASGQPLPLVPTPTASGGHGGTQGNSHSNPDGNGVDKPFPADGQPAESQGPDFFDGNNGCGQDKKEDIAPDHQGGFDDNNGNCGPKTPTATNTAVSTYTATATNTAVATNTATATNTAAATNTATATTAAATSTATNTATAVNGTATSVAQTAIAETATAAAATATNTPTNTATTAAATNTPTNTATTAAATNTPTNTATTGAATNTPTNTATTGAATSTATATETAVNGLGPITNGGVITGQVEGIVSGVQGGADVPQQEVAGVQQQAGGVGGVAGATRLPSTGSGGDTRSESLLLIGLALILAGGALASSGLRVRSH